MNQKQVDLLIKNNHKVLPEVGFVREIDSYNSKVSITYNSLLNVFCLNVYGTTLNPNEIKSFQEEVIYKTNLVNQLNELK